MRFERALFARSDESQEETDNSLLSRLQNGDLEALGLLYRRYARIVYSICWKILNNKTEAEDAVQEVFLALYRKCHSFDARKGAARSWIISFAYTKCFDHHDRLISKKRGGGMESEIPFNFSGNIRSTDPADLIVWNKRMSAAFKTLPLTHQEAMRLFFFEDLNFDEIASKQGCSRRNANHRVYRGLKQLRRLLFDTKRAEVIEMKAKRP